MATKQKITIYFPETEESELWEAIQRLPKGVRGMILRDIIRKELLGDDPKFNLSSASSSTKLAEKPKPIMDEEAALSIPIFKKRG